MATTYDDTGDIQYRFAYYMLGLKKDHWFGRAALLIPPNDLESLLKEARKRKWKGI